MPGWNDKKGFLPVGDNMKKKSLTMLSVGDISLGLPHAEFFFEFVAPTLRQADIVVGQVEHLFTERPLKTTDGAAPCDPKGMKALAKAGLTVATLAGNHVWDSGPPGIEDTVNGLCGLGIATVGAGANIDEATKPAIIQKDGVKIGFLDYNCVGLKETYAGKEKAGCAYVHVMTYYDLDYAGPGGPPTIYTFCEPKSFGSMSDNVRRLRSSCDVLVVSLHKGLVHTPVKLAQYEREVTHAAIDAGADIIFSHHAHILKGIEVYRGKVIYHGLSNFVNVVRHLTVDPSKGPDQWAKRRKEIFGFEPDPEYPPFYPFHPEAKNSIIATCTIEGGKIERVGFLPCLVNKKGQPEVLKQDERGRKAFDYVETITRGANLNARYEWDGDEVVILT
jgi:hypothetical protein